MKRSGTVIFNAEHDGGVSTMNLPIGTNNSPAAVREIVEMPPPAESASSPMGKQRLYDMADLEVAVQGQQTRHETLHEKSWDFHAAAKAQLLQAQRQGLRGIPRAELLGYLSAAADAVDYLNDYRRSFDGRPGLPRPGRPTESASPAALRVRSHPDSLRLSPSPHPPTRPPAPPRVASFFLPPESK